MKAEEFLPNNQDTKELNGVVIRKGTVGTFIANLLLLKDSAKDSSDYANALQDAKELYAIMRNAGITDHLQIKDPSLRALFEN